jgi:hypothetical protein
VCKIFYGATPKEHSSYSKVMLGLLILCPKLCPFTTVVWHWKKQADIGRWSAPLLAFHSAVSHKTEKQSDLTNWHKHTSVLPARGEEYFAGRHDDPRLPAPLTQMHGPSSGMGKAHLARTPAAFLLFQLFPVPGLRQQESGIRSDRDGDGSSLLEGEAVQRRTKLRDVDQPLGKKEGERLLK